MSWGFDDTNVGGRLQVGTGIVPAIKEGDEKINGSMHCEGPAAVSYTHLTLPTTPYV